uniref:Uncharacterized protein n=1 Tax=Globodera rostochiensis TaxID=31243 RepID=A0A914GXN8_GLORO
MIVLSGNALLTAQKHIDSALHIDEDEEDEQEEEIDQDGEDTEKEDAFEGGMMSSIDRSAVQQTDEAVALVSFLDVDLNRAASPHSQWASESTSNMHPIVDTEPNPIRDAHEPNHIFHYSPSSHSPDDEESSQNGQSSSSAPINSILDLSLINLDKEKAIDDECDGGMTMPGGSSERTLDRFEDVRTIASSDIEVIRQMDDWSVTSSHTNSALQPNNTHQQVVQSPSLKELHQSRTPPELIKLDTTQLSQDQKIEELGRVNDNLRMTNANLMAKNKQKIAAESKLQSQFDEKEKQLNDLLDEGRKLSEYSGRQAKEIRKLKQQLEQLDVVSAARDSAVEELQEAHQQLQEQENVVEHLRDEIENSEQQMRTLQMELGDKTTHAENLEGKMRVEKTLKTTGRERDELAKENKKLAAKMINKKAQDQIVDERERGLEEDLKLQRLKNASANSRIRELEQRIERIQDANRDIAVEISNANSPLLNTISSLEEKLLGLERDNDNLARSLRQMSDQLNAQKKKHQTETEMIARNLQEERQNNAQKTEELAKAFNERADQQNHIKKLEDELSQSQREHTEKVCRLERKMEELEKDIKTKRDELTELQRRNCELQQRIIASTMERRNNANSLLDPLAQQQKRVGERANEEDETIGTALRRGEELLQQHRHFVHQQNGKIQPKLTIVAPSYQPQRLGNSSISSGHVSLDIRLQGEHSPNNNYSLDAGSAEYLRSELDLAHSNLFQLHERFENLLEMYGGCLETIEELKYDNEDLRKLCKEQALGLVDLQPAAASS